MSATSERTTGKIATYGDSKSENGLSVGMQLFGIPYQFLPSVDQRVPGVSDKVGRKFIDNVITDSAIVTIIPGEPRYLPGVKDKASFTNGILSATNNNFSELKTILNNNNNPDMIRLYDFQSAYMKYYQYVNILCRSCAAYLEITSDTGYKINNNPVPNFLNYDWKNYRWSGRNYNSVAKKITSAFWNTALKAIQLAGNSLGKILTANTKTLDTTDLDTKDKTNEELDTTENVFQTNNFIQFYCEADSSRSGESLSNSTQQSSVKQAMDSGSSVMKEVAFLTNSGGIDTDSLSQLGAAANEELEKALGTDGTVNTGTNTTVGSIVSRILSGGKSVFRGDNFMMPDIWSGSDNSASHDLTFKFKAMYGNKLSVYTDVIVPLMHVIALAYPRSTTANTYASPPLVKVYQKGAWSCNLGIISSIQITKDEVQEAWNVDGLCTEITVSLGITDLYSDIALTPANNPLLFATNSSLIEYLATTCGLDLVAPQLKTKISNIWNGSKNFIKSIPKNAMESVSESIDRFVSGLTGL